MKTSQMNEVKKHLLSKGSITSMDAIDLFGATRLSAIIFNLRDEGMRIETERVEHVNRYGHKMSYGKYVLKPDL